MASAARTSRLLSSRTHRIVAAGIPLLLAAGIAGCKQKPGPDVVATVNGHALVRADLDRMYQTQLGQNPGQTPSPENFLGALAYGLVYIAVLLAASTLIFKRRNFK